MSDIGPKVPLEPLDPGRESPDYWNRFHDRVMAGAAPRLKARARSARLTVEDVLLSWSRLVVPAAAAVAILAGSFVLRESDPSDGEVLLGVEDFFRIEVERSGIPAFFTTAGPLDRDQILFALEDEPGGAE